MMSHRRGPRRRLRFRLRTLLVLLTIFSIGLAIRVNNTRRQERAIAAIERMGGSVWYDFHYRNTILDLSAKPQVSQWLWPIFGKGSVECVDFTGPVNDHDLRDLPKHLATLSSFRLLSLDGTNIGDATLKRMKELRNFTNLNLDTTQVTDDGLECVVEMRQIEGLSLVFADRVSDAGLRRLADHPRLQQVQWNTRKRPAKKEWRAYNELIDALRGRSRGGQGH